MGDDKRSERAVWDEAGEGARPEQTGPLPRAPDWAIRLLLEVTTALTSTLDLDDVLGEILTRTVRLADAAAGTIILVDEQGLAARKIAVRGGLPYEVADEVVSRVLSCGLAHWVYVSMRTAWVPDVRADQRWLQIPGDWYAPRSAVCVPVTRHGRVLGTLTLTHVHTDHFAASLVELLEALAGQAAIAIENARLFGEVQRLAITDGLTGLYNRRHLLELAEAELARPRASPASVALADVDLFKRVNDTYGHMVGDEVLCGIVARLRAALGARGVLGRYGGEEFAALLPGCSLRSARGVAEQLRRAVSDVPIDTSRGPVAATVSLGVAEAPTDAATELRELLRTADERLYAAKAAGRNCVR